MTTARPRPDGGEPSGSPGFMRIIDHAGATDECTWRTVEGREGSGATGVRAHEKGADLSIGPWRSVRTAG
ncbi:hypothetical protein GCM10009792_11500 [Microcella alkalica]